MGHGEDRGQRCSTSRLKTETRATQKLRERSYAICVLLSGKNEGRIEVEETYSYSVIDHICHGKNTDRETSFLTVGIIPEQVRLTCRPLRV